MIKSDFTLVMDSLNARVNACKKNLGHIITTDDIKKLTIQEAIDLKQFCADEEPIMTKIAMVDLYHIIGMGELSPVQMSTFVYKVRDYLQYRPRIKAIASNLDSIFSLPKLPVSTKYKLMGLCDLVLMADVDAEFEDACVADYTAAKATCSSSNTSGTLEPFTDELPFRLAGRTIEVDLTRSAKFAAILTKIFKCPMGEGNFLNRVALKKSYGSIDWISDENKIATGVCSSDNNFKKLEAYYRNYSMYK